MKIKPPPVGHGPNRLPLLGQRLGAIEYRAPGALTAYSNNPRKHSEKQLVKLMASISEFGFALPVLVDKAAEIIAGHARVEAAKRLGLAEVPVLVAEHWSTAQVRAYRLLDNRSAELATWDEQALAFEIAAIIELDETPIEILGWETAEIDVILDAASGGKTEADPADDVPQPVTGTVSAAGDLWQLGSHRLLCSSSLEAVSWERLMAGATAAMVFSDPPYNVPVSGHVCGLGKVQHAEFAMASGEMSKAEFTTFLTDVVGKMVAHLKDGAVVDLCMDWRGCAQLQNAMEANGLSLLNMCIWNKSNGGMGSLYRSKHEIVLIGRRAPRRTRTTSNSASTGAIARTSGTTLGSTPSARAG